MASIVYVSSSTTDVITEIASTSEVIISNLQGPQGATGPQGPQGTPGGIASVVAPITNAGTETAAIIGINSSSANTANYVVQRDANKEFVAGAVTIDTTLTPTSAPGKLYWDGGGTVNLGLAGGNVSVALGENLVSYVTNAEATTLAVGEVVYVLGAAGDRPSVKRASNTSEVTSSKTLGIVAESIAAGQIGFVITRGIIGGLTLGSYTAGAPVYLGSTAGTFTSTKPVAPANLVALGWVIRANNGNGQIYVNVQNGFELEELHNVLITSAANGNFLVYDSADGLWKNEAISATAPITYNAGTNTIAANAATTSASGVVQLSDSTSTTSSVLAATPTAVKAAYDLATTANATANAAIPLAQKAAANGVATLGADGLVPTNQLPALAITNTFVVNSQAAMLALTAQPGDVAIRTDLSESYILTADPASTLANWQELLTPPDAVTSVDGRVGAVTLTDKYAQLATANTFTLGPNIFQSGGIANVALIARGATGQTANIQEWRDGSNSNVMRLTNTGTLILNAGQGISAQYITGVAQGAGAYLETSSTNMSILTRAAANIGLIIRGATSQTANLQEWQNSAGTVLANIDSGGQLLTQRLIMPVGAYIVDSSAQAPQLRLNTGGFEFNTRLTTNVGIKVIGVASQTADLQQWQNSAGTVLANIDSSGFFYNVTGVRVGSVSFAGLSYNGISNPTGITGLPTLIVKGVASQTATLQEWHSSGGLVANIDTSGQFRGSSLLNINSFNNSTITVGNSGTTIQTGITTNVALIVKNTNASATADLLQLQNSAGTVLARFTSIGNGAIPRLTVGDAAYTSAGTLNVLAGSAATVGEVIRGAAAQTANLTEWQTSAGTVLASVSSAGSLVSTAPISTSSVVRAGTTVNTSGQLTVISDATTRVSIGVRGASGQTANLQEFLTFGGETLSSINAAGTFVGNVQDSQLIQYGAEGSVLQNIPTRVHPAETLLKQAVWWIDSAHSGSSGQAIKNLGWGGSALDATAGSSTAVDTNDPLYLAWDGVNYVYVTGVNGNYLSTPDANALDITGDIDLRALVALDDWTPSIVNCIIAKEATTTTRSYRFSVNTNGTFVFVWSSDGTAINTATSSVAPTITDGTQIWMRVTRNATTGTVQFFTSSNGTTWTQLGTDVAGTTGSMFSSTSEVSIGQRILGTAEQTSGKIYRAQILNGIDGVPVLDVDTSQVTSGSATSFTALTGQTVTINRSTAGRKTTCVTHPVWLFGTDDYMEVNNRWLERTDANYLYLPGVVGNSASTPDSAAVSITGDLDVRVKVALDDWTPSTNSVLIGKGGSWYLYVVLTTGRLFLTHSADGTTFINKQSTASPTVADGGSIWVRVTLDVNNGAGGNDAIFYTSPDGTTWTQLGTTVTTAGTTSLNDSVSGLEVGQIQGSLPARGKFFRAQVLNGINGTVAFDANFETGITTNLPTTFIESSANAATVTINYSGTGYRSAGVIASTYVFPGNPNTFKLSAYSLLDFGASDSFTAFFVVRQWATPTSFGNYLNKKDNATNGGSGYRFASYATGLQLFGQIADGTNFTPDRNGAVLTSGTLMIGAGVADRSAQTFLISQNAVSTATASLTGFGAISTPYSLRVGAATTGAGVQDFEFVSSAIFRRALTAAEIATLNSYFQGRVA